MLAGFAIFKQLVQLAECIEVFPQAIVRGLGSGQRHKSEPGAVDDQLKAASRFTGWPIGNPADPLLTEIAWGTRHDCLDAYLSRWVASLAEADRVAFGCEPEAVIWSPRLPDASRSSSPRGGAKPASAPRTSGASEATASSGKGTFLCPGCGGHLFKRWPWGWDGHAAYTCTGLIATTPDGRKAEYRRRFAHLF